MHIIFHHPLPLNKDAKSASGIRPLRMLAAFESIGCKVDLVTGYSSERNQCIAMIKNNVRCGVKYDFVYSESSTLPTILTDSHHIPLHPLIDSSFFRFCNKNSIPIGLFYRDIYWLFDNYGLELKPITRMVAKLAYWFDIWVYKKTLTKLFIPSSEMGDFIPKIDPDIFIPLPPGHVSPDMVEADFNNNIKTPLKLFYVGGISIHYQLHKLLNVIAKLPDVELTICTRKAEWQAVKHEYPTLTPNIKIIHATGAEMESHLLMADIAVLFVKPHEYRDFASPFKLYEYIGFCKPILATEDTLSGKFIRENGIGWSIPYNEAALRKLLIELIAEPSLVNDFSENLKDVAKLHSWNARAEKVIHSLVKQ